MPARRACARGGRRAVAASARAPARHRSATDTRLAARRRRPSVDRRYGRRRPQATRSGEGARRRCAMSRPRGEPRGIGGIEPGEQLGKAAPAPRRDRPDRVSALPSRRHQRLPPAGSRVEDGRQRRPAWSSSARGRAAPRAAARARAATCAAGQRGDQQPSTAATSITICCPAAGDLNRRPARPFGDDAVGLYDQEACLAASRPKSRTSASASDDAGRLLAISPSRAQSSEPRLRLTIIKAPCGYRAGASTKSCCGSGNSSTGSAPA